MTALITSWRQKVGGDNGNMVTLPWLPFHNRLMKLSYVWRSTTKMVDLNVYNTCVFALCNREKLWAQSHYNYIEQPSYKWTLLYVCLLIV